MGRGKCPFPPGYTRMLAFEPLQDGCIYRLTPLHEWEECKPREIKIGREYYYADYPNCIFAKRKE